MTAGDEDGRQLNGAVLDYSNQFDSFYVLLVYPSCSLSLSRLEITVPVGWALNTNN